MCFGEGLVTYLSRSEVDGYELAGMAKVLSGARRIDRDEYRPIGPTDLYVCFPNKPTFAAALRQDKHHIWLAWLGASSPGGY